MDYRFGDKSRWRREYQVVGSYEYILDVLPFSAPFLFVDSITSVDEDHIEGKFTFQSDMECYRGHFTDYAVTPGTLLTECCAQIGLVCFGIYLLREEIEDETQKKPMVALTSADMEFYHAVLPGETVRVRSEKVFFRFGKLKCLVRMYNTSGKLICKGTLAGMIKKEDE